MSSEMRPSNPYIAGDPVTGDGRFIGREDVLRGVLRILRNPNANAIVLYGQRRVGKTSILLQLEAQLEAAAEYTPVYFDLMDKAALSLGELLYQLARRIAQVVGLDTPSRPSFDAAGDYFRTAFLPAAAEEAGRQSLVLLFDEFDVLDLPHQERASQSFFPYLRGWMADAKYAQFVFVLGRRPEDLTTDTLAAFKQARSLQVSLMDEAESAALVRQSEENESLYWSDAAARRVWRWTRGHPFLTQLLCSEVWEAAHDRLPAAPPTVEPDEVDEALEDALEQGEQAFQWIWNGLPPAERIVMAAMAAEDDAVVSLDELTEILNRSGVRLILRELELAPDTLVKWDLLRPVDGGYRFAIPLLKRWVADNKPLSRVKLELDSLEPLANNLFQSARGIYGMGDLTETERLLRRALDINPNHMQARLLLGRVLLAKGEPADAVKELETVYEFDPPLARRDLVKTLLALTEQQDSEGEELEILERILALNPNQPAAQKRKQAIWRERAEVALQLEDFAAAREAYRAIEDEDGLAVVEARQWRVVLNQRLEQVATYEDQEDWDAAVAVYEHLLAEFPTEGNWQERLAQAKQKARLDSLYRRAVHALETNDEEKAQILFGEIIGVDPTYKEASRYLLLAIRDVDIEELVTHSQELQQKYATMVVQVESLKRQLEAERIRRHNVEQAVARLQEKVSTLQASNIPKDERVTSAEKEQQEELQTPTFTRWSLWNPLAYLWLLWWLLVQPEKFRVSSDVLDWEKEHGTWQRAWLASSLIWLPLAIGTGWLLLDKNLSLESIVGYPLLVIISLAWLATGKWGYLESENYKMVVMGFGVAIGMVISMAISAALIAAFEIVIGMTVSVLFGVLVFAAVVMAIRMGTMVEGMSIVNNVAVGVLFGMVGGMMVGIFLGWLGGVQN